MHRAVSIQHFSQILRACGCLALLMATAASARAAENADKVIVYPSTDAFAASQDFTLKVRTLGGAWSQVAAYEVPVSMGVPLPGHGQMLKHTDGADWFEHATTSMASFDFSGRVEVAITWKHGVPRSVQVRPQATGIAVSQHGDMVSFVLERPINLSVEIDGDIFHNLQLFASEAESIKPKSGDDHTIYYGPGIHVVGTVQIPSHTTVYLAGGAVVIGNFIVSHVQQVHIGGHGTLASEKTVAASWREKARAEIEPNQVLHTASRHDAILIEFSRDVSIEGITEVPSSYSVLIGQSENVAIRNIKSISAGGNNDGIDVFTSKHVLIDGVFLRNSDDCIAIYGHRWQYYGDLADVTVRASTLWADVAHPILVGTHGDSVHPETLSGLRFQNLDILDHREPQIDYQGCMSLNAGDSNLIRDVVFEDIRVDDFRMGQLLNLRVMFNHKYNTSPGRGIEDVVFRNIRYTGTHANPSVIAGYDDDHAVRRVSFEDLTINGVKIADDMPGKPLFYKTGDLARISIGEHVDGVAFRVTSDSRVGQ